MRIFKFILALLATIGLIYVLSSRISVEEGVKTPQMGKFLNPFVGFWQNAEPSIPDYAKEINLPAFKGKGKVVYDDRLVPHIFADNLEDAYYLQGFVTAQNRLWQMDFQVMAAAGRLSEILGANPRIIEYDKLQRRRGMVHGAEILAEKWETQEGSNYLHAYVDGVNAYLNQLKDKDIPVEYKILGYRPEAWTSLKSALFLMNMSSSLARHDDDLEAHNALKHLDRELFDFFFPADYDTEDPIIPADQKWDFEPVAIPTPTIDEEQSVTYQPFSKVDKGIGSNNWAVNGSKTLSGNPILCGDPHLNLTLPAIWYEMQINTPECNVYGATLPGIYGVIIGFNEHIAWSMTNVGRDVLDWYTIEWKDDTRMEYKYGDEYRDVVLKIEEIKVRDSLTILDTVRYTHHGPIVYEAENHPQKDMAFRWMAFVPNEKSNDIIAFPKLNQAKNYEDYKNALMNYHCPAQNFVFASKEGDIALWAQGSFPLKAKEQGRFILDGSNPDNDWHGFIPKEHNPHTLNPARNFVASANQKSTAPNYPYYYSGGFSEYRGRYLNRELRSMDSITIQDMKDLQHSSYSLFAEEGLPIMLENLLVEQLDKEQLVLVEELKSWDNIFNRENTIAPLFMEWYNELYFKAWEEFQLENEEHPMLFPDKRRTLQIMAEQPDFEYFDNKNTKDTIETLQDITTEAFMVAYQVFTGMKDADGKPVEWGKYKQTVIRHLSRSIEPFHVPVYTSGQKNALNANGPTSGPSWRMIVELGKEVKAYGVYPGGQSGNPGSRFYSNFVEDWSNKVYYELLFMKNAEEKSNQVLFVQQFN